MNLYLTVLLAICLLIAIAALALAAWFTDRGRRHNEILLIKVTEVVAGVANFEAAVSRFNDVIESRVGARVRIINQITHPENQVTEAIHDIEEQPAAPPFVQTTRREETDLDGLVREMRRKHPDIPPPPGYEPREPGIGNDGLEV